MILRSRHLLWRSQSVVPVTNNSTLEYATLFADSGFHLSIPPFLLLSLPPTLALPTSMRPGRCLVLGVAVVLGLASKVAAQSFFEESARADYYDSGLGFSSAGSRLDVAPGTVDKLPISRTALFDRDAISLKYTSVAGGDWSAFLIAPNFATQNLSLADTLGLWIWSPQVLAKAELPALELEGSSAASRTTRLQIGDFIQAAMLPAKRWTQVRVPLAPLRAASANASFDFTRVKAVILRQNSSDGQSHQLLVDQVHAYSARTSSIGQLTAAFTVSNYPEHREIELANRPSSALYHAAVLNGELIKVLTARTTDTLLHLWTGDGQQGAGALSLGTYTPGFGLNIGTLPVQVDALPPPDDAVLWDMTQRSTLRYFWDFAHPTSGLARERNTSGNTVTTGGSGFGLMAWLVGIQRGWLTRDEVAARLLKTLDFLERADRFHGAWPHWMDGRTGRTIPFSPRDNGGDLVETAFMAQGLLAVRQYFDGNSPAEDSIRQRCTRLWEDIEWDWYRRPGEDVLTWHWSPTQAWAINLKVTGFNEAQIVYLLAIASPTHAVPGSLYRTGWTVPGYRSFRGRYGIFLPSGPPSGGPMFFAHYSYLGFDPRFWRDAFANYFVRNGQHVDYQVAYAIDNPADYRGYSVSSWGLTASDDPTRGYAVHAAAEAEDNGTLTPTAAIASMPYRPAAATAALRTFYQTYGPRVFGPMGFYDAFNPTVQWFATSTLAIDQGPIVGMIENHRSGLLWRLFMANPEIEPALLAAGFQPDSTAVGLVAGVLAKAQVSLYPNPSFGDFTVRLRGTSLAETATIELLLFDALGRVAFRQNLRYADFSAGAAIHTEDLPAGSYRLQLRASDAAAPGQYNTLLQITKP